MDLSLSWTLRPSRSTPTQTPGAEAIIRFTGQTAFIPGVWVGVELEDSSGKNDGSVQGVRYFECPLGHGMFVRPASLKVLAGQPAPFLTPAKKKAAPE